MRNKILFAAVIAGLLAGGSALTFHSPSANAAPAKNLKIYPKGTDKKVIKKDMKLIAKALGVKCDHCHNMDAMEEDTEMKTKSRSMMRMMKSANATLKKDGFKESVTCKTCHWGEKKPKK